MADGGRLVGGGAWIAKAHVLTRPGIVPEGFRGGFPPYDDCPNGVEGLPVEGTSIAPGDGDVIEPGVTVPGVEGADVLTVHVVAGPPVDLAGELIATGLGALLESASGLVFRKEEAAATTLPRGGCPDSGGGALPPMTSEKAAKTPAVPMADAERIVIQRVDCFMMISPGRWMSRACRHFMVLEHLRSPLAQGECLRVRPRGIAGGGGGGRGSGITENDASGYQTERCTYAPRVGHPASGFGRGGDGAENSAAGLQHESWLHDSRRWARISHTPTASSSSSSRLVISSVVRKS